jgi:hypothetical protein
VGQGHGASHGAGHGQPQDEAEEIIHDRIRLHHLSVQTSAREESKNNSMEIR